MKEIPSNYLTLSETSIPYFTPSLMSFKELNSIYVEREVTVQEILTFIHDRIGGILKIPEHHILFIGPRGVGKTHLISLIYHYVDKELRNHLFIAWLREEEYGIVSFLELLIRIFRVLINEYEDKYNDLEKEVEKLYVIPIKEAEEQAKKLLDGFLKKHSLLLLIENLDELFARLEDKEQQKLYTYLESNPSSFIILATAKRRFDAIKEGSLFDGFFKINELNNFTIEEAVLLVKKIAEFRSDEKLVSFILTPQGNSRIHAIYALAGGNPRIYVILSQFLTFDSLNKLIPSFRNHLDALTPFYQERMSNISHQQKKIVEFLSDQKKAVSVKEIARYCFMSHQTASSQLKELIKEDYVKKINWRKFPDLNLDKRESYYELSQPLMRFCLNFKNQRGEPIDLILEFLRGWYSPEELQRNLEQLPMEDSMRKDLLQAHQKGSEYVKEEKVKKLLKNFQTSFEDGKFEQALKTINELLEIRPDTYGYFNQSLCYYHLKRYEEGLRCYDQQMLHTPSSDISDLDQAMFFSHCGKLLYCLGRLEEAKNSFKKAVSLNPQDKLTLRNQGIVLFELGQFEDAKNSFNKAIAIDENYARAWYSKGIALLNIAKKAYDSKSKFHNDVLKDLAEALECCDKAIAIDEKDTLAWHNRGTVIYDQATILYDIGSLTKKSNGFKEALQKALNSFEHSIKLDEHNSMAWNGKGAVLNKLGGMLNKIEYNEKALFCFKKVIEEYHEQSSFVYFNLADTLFALNRWEEGFKQLENALSRFKKETESKETEAEDIICRLLGVSKMWPTYIEKLINLYKNHNLLSSLALGLTKSIRELNFLKKENKITKEMLKEWFQLWHKFSVNEDEFKISINLLDTATRFLQGENQSIIYKLPDERRRLLIEILEIKESTETK